MAAAVRPKLTVQPAMDFGDEEGRREREREREMEKQASTRSVGRKDLKWERDEALQLLGELKGVKRERDEARQLVSEWRRKCGVMQTECSKVKQDCDELRRRNNECQAIIVGYEHEMERMKEVTDDSGVGNGCDVKRDLRSQLRDTVIRNQELERLRRTTAEYEARISGLESQRQELVERIGVSAGREGELGRALEAEQQAKEKANSRNRALSQQIAELHERFERLSHDRVIPGEESDKLQRECQTLKEENVMTWKRYTEAAHERDRVSKELYRVLDKLRVSSEELEVMSVRLKEEQSRRQEVEKRMLESMGHRTDTDSNNSGRHDGVNKQAEKDLEFAIQSYHSTLKQRDSLLEEVGQLRMENDVLTNQARIKTQELNELRQKHNSLSSKAFDLRGMVHRLREAHVPELVTVVVPSAKELGILLETYVHVREVQPDSLASQRGIMPGDIVLQVSDQPLANLSVADVGRLIELCHSDMSLLLRREPTARLDDITVNEMSLDAASLHTEGENKSLDSYRPNAVSKRRDVSSMKGLYGSGSSLTMGTKYSEVASSLSTPTFMDGPSLVAQRHEREVILEPPPVNSSMESEGLDLRLKGGNMVGIFVAHVRSDGPAGGKHGLKRGDQLLKVNNCAMTSCTLEEAHAMFLQSMLLGPVRLTVSRNTKKYRSLAVPYDSFFVRCNFSYDGSAVNEMNFGIGDVLHVTESAPVHFKGSWMARRLGVHGIQAAFGAVPNESRAQAYLRASGRYPDDHPILAYERIDPSQDTGFSSQFFERQYSRATRERTASLGDQLSLHDRVSAQEPWTGGLPTHITEELCQLLDRDSPTERNWRDLAVMLGLEDSIPDLAKHTKPTAEVLKSWHTMKSQNSSVEWLVRALFRMGRVDAGVLVEPFAEHTVSLDTVARSEVVGTINV